MARYTHQNAQTQFVDANGIRFAYRRVCKPNGVPRVFYKQLRGTMGYLDPAGTDGLAKNRDVILRSITQVFRAVRVGCRRAFRRWAQTPSSSLWLSGLTK